MHQLVDPTDVKKMYRKACLAVHPDKQMGTDNENLSKLIFMELNEVRITKKNTSGANYKRFRHGLNLKMIQVNRTYLGNRKCYLAYFAYIIICDE